MGRTKKRKEQREKERRQQRRRIIAVMVGVIALVAVVLVIITTRPVEVTVDDDLLALYDGLPRTTTDRGFPRLGNPEAPARIFDYSSFACPACAEFNEDVSPDVVERVRAGEASFTFVPVLLPGEDDRAARAALCAAEQGFFWEYHDLLFSWQQVYQATAFQNARLIAGAEALNMDVDEFNACRSGDAVADIIDNASAAFNTSGGSGTPTITINDDIVNPTASVILTTIDAIMETAQPVPLEIPEEAPAETEEPTAEIAETEEATDEPAETDEPTAEIAETEEADE